MLLSVVDAGSPSSWGRWGPVGSISVARSCARRAVEGVCDLTWSVVPAKGRPLKAGVCVPSW